MSEIKNTFTGGKMNKDLDERLVPNGEYRDAMNVQVSTSDGSDVGAVQNLLGNTLIPSVASATDFCVGSIPDEKSDSLYWLNAGPPKTNLLETATQDSGGDNTATFGPWQSYWVSAYPSGLTGGADGAFYTTGDGVEFKDTILEYKDNTTNPIFVDVHTKWFKPAYTRYGGSQQLVRGDYLVAPDNLIISNGQTTGINGIQKGAKLNFYYAVTPITTNSYLVKHEHTVTEVRIQQDLGDLPMSGGTHSGIIKDVFKIEPPLNPTEKLIIEGDPLYTQYWFVEIENPRILNFRKEQLITGINIVDDMLFWTDSISEPKKISIPRSKQGTNANGMMHTTLVTNGINTQVAIKLENTTVIKKAPTAPPAIEFQSTTAPFTSGTIMTHAQHHAVDNTSGLPTTGFGGSNGSRDTVIGNGNVFWDWSWEGVGVLPSPGVSKVLTFQPIDEEEENTTPYTIEDPTNPGQAITIGPTPGAKGNIPWKNGATAIGDIVIFSHRDDGQDYIRAEITEEFQPEQSGWPELQPMNVPYAVWLPPFSVDSNGVPTGTISRNDNAYHFVHQRMFRVEIISISQDTPMGWQWWDVRMEDKESNLFERKFPRLALRYRYEDGEYSSFGPFTDAVFSPGNFDYDSKDAVNKAMINNLKSIEVKDLINSETPDDVVQVDIVYKDEDSANIYLVDNVKPEDVVYPPATVNAWNSPGLFAQGSYTIESESIFTVLPSNQLLRPFDNVPRKALAQEVVGNRIVYGNYVQDYNLLDATENKITPLVVGNVRTREVPTEIGFGGKSVKSEREYQLGVVYSDEFGRESSVLSSQGSVFTITKQRSDSYNQIFAKVENPPPKWATHFKIFVKETTSEYYNLAMDRVYKAEDDGIWMSFPSAERNKVDEETYLILKKATDTNVAMKDVGKYKIVAIENEAPEYIKTSWKKLGEVAGQDCVNAISSTSGNIISMIPVGGGNILQQGVIAFNIDKTHWDFYTSASLDGAEPYAVSFFQPISGKETEKYKVAKFTVDSDAVGTITANPLIPNQGVYYFVLEKPITDEDGSWLETSAGVNDPDAGIKIYVKKVDNKPEFDGRFFVKIIRDSIIDTHITTLIKPTLSNYIVTKSAQLHWVADGDAPNSSNFQGTRNSTTLPTWTSGSASNTLSLVSHYTGNTSNSSQHVQDWASTANNVGVIGSNNEGEWFIDNAYYAGTQPGNDTNPSSAFSFPQYDATTFGSPDYPENYGRGIYTDGSKVYMELSFSVLGIDRLFNDLDTVEAWEEAENLDDHQVMISALRKQDQKFVINGDETQYKIVSWSIQRRYNHTSLNEANASWNNPTNTTTTDPLINTHFGNSNVDGALTSANQNNAFGRNHNRRLTFILEVEPVDVGGSDFYTYISGQDLGDMGPINTSRNFVIDFIEDYTDSASFDSQMSDNPTIWETEPKQKEGLDLYYEATRKFKGVIFGDENVSELIPFPSSNSPEVFSTLTRRINSPIMLPPINPYHKIFKADYVTKWDGVDPESWVRIQLAGPWNAGGRDANIIPAQFAFQGMCIGSMYIASHPNYTPGCWHLGELPTQSILVEPLLNGDTYIVDLPDGSSFELELDWTKTRAYWDDEAPGLAGLIYFFSPVVWNNKIGLSWYNCISFGNGVESDRIRDDFNALQLTNGVKVSRPGEDQYKEQHLKNSLIFSGLYNAKTGINNLNQFIAAEGITKDLNPSYGSIQKLHARDTDLVTLCEDKIIKVLSNKDAVFNADENPQLLATNRVLGQSIPFSGEYGISKDPASFASEAYRAYFTDRQRGKVIRLSRDGITPISDYGMNDWFNDNLKIRTTLYGSYDIKRGSYNLTMWVEGDKHHTISFNEKVKGWTSFKSFIPESALSLSGEYFTIKTGLLYQHHIESNVERNTFYGVFTPSTVNVLLNSNPEIVKNFQTLNYEGSQAKIDAFVNGVVDGVTYTDNQYYNLGQKKGWYVEKIKTNCEDGTVNEFIDKECKWFNHIKGSATNIISDIDPSQFSFQGIGNADEIQVLSAAGCMDDGNCSASTCGYDSNTPSGCTPGVDCIAAINYDAQAMSDDGSCYYYLGCTDTAAFNYDPNADFDDGSCVPVVLGCLNDPTAPNYGGPGNLNGITIIVNTDDGSCIVPIYGCTDSTAMNYDPNANTPCDGGVMSCVSPNCTGPGNNECCVSIFYGCTDSTGANSSMGVPPISIPVNYNPQANVDDGSCIYPFYACTDPAASNQIDMTTYTYAIPCTNSSDCTTSYGATSSGNWVDGTACTGSNPNDLCCDYGGCPEYANTNPQTQYSHYNFDAPNADPNVTVDDGSCVMCGPLDNTGGGGFDVNQVSLTPTVNPNTGAVNINLTFDNHTVQASNSNVNAPFQLELAYREQSCTSTGGYSDWAFDSVSQTFLDSCVTHSVNNTSLVAQPLPQSVLVGANSLTPGATYDFAVRLRCDRSVWPTSATTALQPVYDQWYTGGELQNATTLIPGCTDPNASNYPTATSPLVADYEDGSCQYITCTDSSANNDYEFPANSGTTYSASTTPHPTVTNSGTWIPDNTNLCTYDNYGCIHNYATNYDSTPGLINCTNPSTQNNCTMCDYTCNAPNVVLAIGDSSGANTDTYIHISSADSQAYNVSSNNAGTAPSTEFIYRFKETTTGSSWSVWYGYYDVGETIGTNFTPGSTYEFHIIRLCADPFNQFQNGVSASAPSFVVSSTQHITGVVMDSPPPPPVLGCTDSNADNYDSSATQDNGLCTYVYGCLDSTYGNYIGDGTESFWGCDSTTNVAGTAPVTYDSTTGEYDLTNVDTTCCAEVCPDNTALQPEAVTISHAPNNFASEHYNCVNTYSTSFYGGWASGSYKWIVTFPNAVFDPKTGTKKRVFHGGTGYPPEHSTIDTVTLSWKFTPPHTNNGNLYTWSTIPQAANAPTSTPFVDGTTPTMSINNISFTQQLSGNGQPWNANAMGVYYPGFDCVGDTCTYEFGPTSTAYNRYALDGNNHMPPYNCNNGWSMTLQNVSYKCTGHVHDPDPVANQQGNLYSYLSLANVPASWPNTDPANNPSHNATIYVNPHTTSNMQMKTYTLPD